MVNTVLEQNGIEYLSDVNNLFSSYSENDSNGNLSIRIIQKESGSYLNIFNEDTIASLGVNSIINYTVPANFTLELDHVSFSGDNIAKCSLELNSSVITKKRSYYTNYNGELDLKKLIADEGDVVTINIENNGDSVAEFNCNLQGRINAKA